MMITRFQISLPPTIELSKKGLIALQIYMRSKNSCRVNNIPNIVTKDIAEHQNIVLFALNKLFANPPPPLLIPEKLMKMGSCLFKA